MAWQDDDLDKNALVDQLGGRGSGAPTSNTQPVRETNAATSPSHNEDVLRAAYQRFTGREADQPGLAAHLKNPGGLQGAVQTIANSPEAQGYGRATAAQQPVVPPAGATPPATTAPPSVQPSIFQGFTPKYAMEGFDFNREQNTGKSAKDAFAYLSQQAPPPPIQDKAALGQWFNQYIKPGMDALGHKVTNVEGDKFGFENWQGKFNVDYGRGAGAEGGALAWQVDDPTAVLSNQAYVPKTNAAQNAALGAAIGGGGQGTSARDKLNEEINALIAGGASPAEADALVSQLRA